MKDRLRLWVAVLQGRLEGAWHRFWRRDLHSERGQHFAEAVYVMWLPEGPYGRHVLLRFWEEIPKGALVAEYRFRRGQEVYKEEGEGSDEPV